MVLSVLAVQCLKLLPYESAWAGQKTPDQALNDTADEANRILAEWG